jgi:hypothetical protein
MRQSLAFFLMFFLVASVNAGGETPFPADWKSWNTMTTPLTTIGALPGCDADVSALPPIYRETVEIYCAVRPEGPGAVSVLVKPDQVESYKTRSGKLGDGSNMILHLKDLKLLFVTGNQDGSALYSVYKEDGTDLTDANPDGILGVNTCRVCHSGYSSFCINGQCGSAQ